MIKKKLYQEEILEATCDICGEDCMKPLYRNADGDRDDHDIQKSFEGMTLNAIWGYPTDHDGEIWEACVCEKCVIEKLKPIINFSIKPY
jgi:hypothetical protein